MKFHPFGSLARRVERRDRKRHIGREHGVRTYAWLGPDLAITETTDGLFLYIDPQDETIAHHLICRGFWEDWVEFVINRALRPGDRVVEVGANLGYHSLKMARAIGPAGRLDTFEANPYLAGLVERSLVFNNFGDRSKVHAVAAGDHAGEVKFSVSRRYGGSGYIADPSWPEPPDRQAITAPCVRLDDVIEGRIDLLRMDAEGSEPLVLKGARELIARSTNIRICMEWAPLMMTHRGDVPELVAWFHSQGFRFWLITTEGGLTELSDPELLALELNDLMISRGYPLPGK